MLGGLYGDLPPPSSEDPKGSSSATASATSTSASVWSTTAKFAPPTLRKPFSVSAPPALLKPKPFPPKPAPAATPVVPQVQQAPSPVGVTPPANLVAVSSTIVDEYDPARPNDYEDYSRERRLKAVEAERLKEIEKRRVEEEERELRRSQRDDRDRDRGMSGEEAWRRRAAMGGGGGHAPRSSSPPVNDNGIGDGNGADDEGDAGGFSIGKSETMGLGVGTGGQMTAAQRMMAKMGWKEGQGLGKQEQGITTPLMAKKTDRRAGVIVNAIEKKGDKKLKSVNFNGPPTRVLLLRNMVGPGEVDDDLEEEVGAECAKYGTVTRVLIFEITEPNSHLMKLSEYSSSLRDLKKQQRLLSILTVGSSEAEWFTHPSMTRKDLERMTLPHCRARSPVSDQPSGRPLFGIIKANPLRYTPYPAGLLVEWIDLPFLDISLMIQNLWRNGMTRKDHVKIC